MSPPVLRLPLVLPGHELRGLAPKRFERAARSCQVGDAAHRTLVVTVAGLAERALVECIAPSAREGFKVRLGQANAWSRAEVKLDAVKRARAETFEAVGAAEEATWAPVALAIGAGEGDLLERQAGLAVRRYVARGVHHAAAGVLLTLDAVLMPSDALSVADEAAGAIAFTRVALGLARKPELLTAARAQAAWEFARFRAKEQTELALALQLFHEYLGAHWKDHADARRAEFDDVLERAFPAPRSSS